MTWISISDKRPPEHREVIVTIGESCRVTSAKIKADGFAYEPHNHFKIGTVTHWQHLPAAPGLPEETAKATESPEECVLNIAPLVLLIERIALAAEKQADAVAASHREANALTRDRTNVLTRESEASIERMELEKELLKQQIKRVIGEMNYA